VNSYRSIVKNLQKEKITEKEISELKLFTNEIQEFLKKMETMDKVDELAISNELFGNNNEDFFLTSQPNDYVKGLDPKEINLYDDIFESFGGVSELLGQQERNLFEEYHRAVCLLDERYQLKTEQLEQVNNFLFQII